MTLLILRAFRLDLLSSIPVKLAYRPRRHPLRRGGGLTGAAGRTEQLPPNIKRRFSPHSNRSQTACILQVLDAQSLEQLAELTLVQARARRWLETVNLFPAAGGGSAPPKAPRIFQRSA